MEATNLDGSPVMPLRPPLRPSPGSPFKHSKLFGINYQSLAAHLHDVLYETAHRRTLALHQIGTNKSVVAQEALTALENAIVLGRIQGLALAARFASEAHTEHCMHPNAGFLITSIVKGKIFAKMRGLKAHRRLSIWIEGLRG